MSFFMEENKMKPLYKNDLIYIRNIKGNKNNWLQAWYAMLDAHLSETYF